MRKLYLEPCCLATAIGSLPHTDPAQACLLVKKYLPQIPVWPQLPRRSFLENMYVQFSQGLPGVVVGEERIGVERSRDLTPELEKLYDAYLKNSPESYALALDYAAGFYAFLNTELGSPLALKGQVTGPFSFGLAVTEENRRPTLYDETLADAIAKLLKLKAAWQERKLRELSSNTIIFVDEPYFSALGSAFVSFPKEQAVKLLEEVLSGIVGLKGVHCCANTDWSLLLATSLDILSLDAYNYIQSFTLYPQEVKAFLQRGGIIAWGIVPNEEQALVKETVASLRDRLEEGMSPLTRKGIRYNDIIQQSLLTPSCGLSSLSLEAAERALELLAGLSQALHSRYAR